MRSATADVIVIGAGLTGALIAARLADQGMRVQVLDAHKAGHGATRHGLGLVTPDPQPAHFARTRQSGEQLKQIAAPLGALRQTCDVIYAASSPTAQRALAQLMQTADGVAWLSATSEPLPGGLSGGLVVKGAAQINLDYLLVHLLRRPGVSVRQHTEVLSLESEEAGKGIFVMCRHDTFFAPRVVLATNVHVGTISPYLAESLRPARGALWVSHPLTPSALPALLLRQPLVIDGGQAALLPGEDGRMRAVAWFWQTQDLARDPLIGLRDFLRRFGLGETAQTSGWHATLTTTTADGAPLVGCLDAGKRVLYAVGLGIYGLAWAAAVADQIVAMTLSP